MPDLNKVIESLEFCAVGAECDHCKYAQENKDDYEGCHHLMADAAELLKSQQAEIAELKAEKHKPNCSSAEHNPSTGKCCGYGRSENDDEPIDACKVCEQYESYGIE